MLVKQFNTGKVEQLAVGFYKGMAFTVIDQDGFFSKEDIEEGIFKSGLIEQPESDRGEIAGLIPLLTIIEDDGSLEPVFKLGDEEIIAKIFGHEIRENTAYYIDYQGEATQFMKEEMEDLAKMIIDYTTPYADSRVVDAEEILGLPTDEYNFFLHPTNYIKLNMQLKNIPEEQETLIQQLVDIARTTIRE